MILVLTISQQAIGVTHLETPFCLKYGVEAHPRCGKKTLLSIANSIDIPYPPINGFN